MTLKQEKNLEAVRRYRSTQRERVRESAKNGYVRNRLKVLTKLSLKGHKKYISRKSFWVKEKGGKCSVCGGVFELPCYDFHHINTNSKGAVDFPFRTASQQRIKNELLKCILICSNCHRLLHYKERLRRYETINSI